MSPWHRCGHRQYHRERRDRRGGSGGSRRLSVSRGHFAPIVLFFSEAGSLTFRNAWFYPLIHTAGKPGLLDSQRYPCL